MQNIRHTMLAAAAIALMAVPAGAQQPGARPGMAGMMPDRMQQEMQGMMQEMQGMMHEMMGAHAYAPDALLDRKADLGLTGDQVRKLEGLTADVKTAKAHAKAEHDIRHARIIEQFTLAKPDPAKVKAYGQEAMQEMAAAHGIELSAFAEAKGLLTDAQRSKVDGRAAEHGKMLKDESERSKHR